MRSKARVVKVDHNSENDSTYRVCIVTGEMAGPDYNGGIGTANRGLASALVRHGFMVDVLYTRVEAGVPFCFRGRFEDQVASFRSNGIRLMHIFHEGKWNEWKEKSYCVLAHLMEHSYDLVFFNDTHGHAFYPVLSKRTGNDKLSNMVLCVVAHSATQWIQEQNQDRISSIEDIILMEMERRSIGMADHLISPSAYMLRKYKEYGWELPKSCFVAPNIIPYTPVRAKVGSQEPYQIDELVFFGRLETRKGLWLFCDALDQIKGSLIGKTVTFLGKPTNEAGESTALGLVRRAAKWPFQVRVLAKFDREQALAYLVAGARLAVMPSFAENSPCAIQECIDLRIPFLASEGSGGEELVGNDSKQKCLFRPTAREIGRKIIKAMDMGVGAASLAFDPEIAERELINWMSERIRSSRDSTEKNRPTRLRGGEKVRSANETILLLGFVSETLLFQDVRALIQRARAAVPQGVSLLLLSSNNFDGLSLGSEDKPVRVIANANLGVLAGEIRALPNGVVLVFDLRYPVSGDWMARARNTLSLYPQLGAVAGLVSIALQPTFSPLPPYVSVPHQFAARPICKIGLSSAVLPLSQESNSGFALIRAAVFPDLLRHPPFKSDRGVVRRTVEWIEEAFFELHSRNIGIELVPDPLVHNHFDEVAAENKRENVSFLRSLVRDHLGYDLGSDQSLIARLAIDNSLEDARRADLLRSLEKIAPRIGAAHAIYDLNSKDIYGTLSRMAYAGGQIPLSEDLLLQTMDSHSSSPTLTLDEIANRRSTEVSLFNKVAEGEFTRMNLDHEWSLELDNERRAFRLHPNSSNEGRAGCLFRALDLSRSLVFCGAITVENSQAYPVRFRVDIVLDNNSGHVHYEQVVRGNQRQTVTFELPIEARRICDVILSTEMATQIDTTLDAWSYWINPRFCGYIPRM